MADTVSLPPASSVPPILQGYHLVFRPTQFMEECAARLGSNFTLQLPRNRPVITFSDPDAIRQIFTGEPDHLYAGEGNRILKPVVGPQSLLLLDGAKHKRDRKLMTPPFHGDRMRAYGDTMLAIMQRHIDEWPSGKVFKLHEAMQAVTLDVILMTVFGLAESDLPRFREALEPFMAFGAQPWMLLFVDDYGELQPLRLDDMLGPLSLRRRFLAQRTQVRQMLLGEIAMRRANPGQDVLSMLIQARFEDGSAMTDDELHDEMLTLLIAGHETTATSLTWTMIHLCQHPAVTDRIRAEAAALTGEHGPVPTDRVGELHYTLAAIKESLRRTPILPIVMRRLQVPQTIGGYELPVGTDVAPNIYLTHHRADLWQDPYSYKPERFLDFHPKPWHFLPFGGGHRTCLGMGFAYYEMKILLAEILRRCDIRLAPGYTPRLTRRNITFAPSCGTPVVMQARRT